MILKGARPLPTIGRGTVRLNCTCLVQRPDFLVIDATNVLSRAHADSKRWKYVSGHSLEACFLSWLAFLEQAVAPTRTTLAIFDNATGPNARQDIDPGYLKRRRLRQGQKSGLPSSQALSQATPSSPNKLVPLTRAAEGAGVFSLVAEGGLEADDLIGAACKFLQGERPKSSIIIASGDSDMQQHLRENVSWMQISPFPTVATPWALSLRTSKDFEQKYRFPPHAYPDYLAMVGKKEASISGVGVGATTASKLLRSYGSIEGLEAAARGGQLKSWGIKVHTAFQEGSPDLFRLRRNRALFSGILEDAGAVLSPFQRTILSKAAVSARNERAAVLQGEDCTALAWAHPLHAGRWGHVEPYARRLEYSIKKSNGETCEVRATSDSGLPVDVLLARDGGTRRAVVVCCECDFERPLEEVVEQLSVPIEDGVRDLLSDAYDSNKVASKLNGAMRHHLTLLRKAGLQPRCIPWWKIPWT